MWALVRGYTSLTPMHLDVTDSPILTNLRVLGNGEHLDSRLSEHHDAFMRTTVTLDRDVERMLRKTMHSSRKSFKETLNAALRAGLAGKPVRKKRSAYVVRARPMGLREGIDPASFNKLADDLDVDAFLDKHQRGPR